MFFYLILNSLRKADNLGWATCMLHVGQIHVHLANFFLYNIPYFNLSESKITPHLLKLNQARGIYAIIMVKYA
jgi:hypothetical protein